MEMNSDTPLRIKIAQKLRTIVHKIFRLFFSFFPFWFILGVIFGSRWYETGNIPIKGGTVFVSGTCTSPDGFFIEGLARDQVIVTSEDANQIKGTIRKNRMFIICDKKDVAIDSLPAMSTVVFSDIFEKIPEVTQITKREIPKKEDIKNQMPDIVNKKIKASGTCVEYSTSERLPPFLDKIISVSNVKKSDKDPNLYYISGIREDKVTVYCASDSIQFKIATEEDLTAIKKEEIPLSYVGKIVFVSGSCRLDQRTTLEKKAYFYNLLNSPVQVSEETFYENSKKVKKISGIITQDKDFKNKRIVCDNDEYPIKIETNSSVIKTTDIEEIPLKDSTKKE